MIDLDSELAHQITYHTLSEKNFEAVLTLPQNLSYFAGHFPHFSVLPAVGLIDISVYLIKQNQLQLKNIRLKKIEHIKIKSPLGPDQQIKISVRQQDEASSYSVDWTVNENKQIALLSFTFDS